MQLVVASGIGSTACDESRDLFFFFFFATQSRVTRGLITTHIHFEIRQKSTKKVVLPWPDWPDRRSSSDFVRDYTRTHT